MKTHRLAPELQVSEWLNTEQPITLAHLRGKVTLLYAFQMLCPSCVTHSMPQATKARAMFSERDLNVIALHTVFEHHDAMNSQALRAFIQEYGLAFPIGIDQPSPDHHIPLTMAAYQLQGTPSAVLLDGAGHLRARQFGPMDDMALGAMVGQLVAESRGAAVSPTPLDALATGRAEAACNDGGCSAP